MVMKMPLKSFNMFHKAKGPQEINLALLPVTLSVDITFVIKNLKDEILNLGTEYLINRLIIIQIRFNLSSYAKAHRLATLFLLC